MSQISVALVQECNHGDREQNLTVIETRLRAAAAAGAQLVLLQELHNGAYFCQVEDPGLFDLAEPVPGPTTDRLSVLAAELGLVIVSSVFERRAAGLYHNTAVVLDNDGSLAGIYRKMHIPDDPGFHEKFYFTPGDLGFEPVETRLGRLGVLVCWDQWYPEAARLMALAGAEMLLYPTAIGWCPDDSPEERERQLDAWRTVQRGHAVANGLPVLVCNRTGFEPSPNGGGIDFWGQSFVAGPQGEILATAGAADTGLVMASVDTGRSETVRRIWPYFRDRRIDAYEELLLRYRDR
jgi:N-carbamoylputrescine amidase